MTRSRICVPAVAFLTWTASLLYWEFLLRIIMNGGIRTGNLSLLVFIPAEALFLTVFTGIIRGHRMISGICNMILSTIFAFYYFAQLVYFRVTGSLLPVGMIGMGDQAFEDFGWTIKSTLIGTLIYVPLLLIPVAVIGFLSLKRWVSRKAVPVSSDEQDEENVEKKKLPLIRGYAILPRIVCLVLSVALWAAGGLTLRLFGQGRDSAWYAYHSGLTDIDTGAERLGVLAATVNGLYAGRFGRERALAETLVTDIDMDALALPDMSEERVLADNMEKHPDGGQKMQKVSSDAAKTADSAADGEQEGDGSGQTEETPVQEFFPRENEAINLAALGGMTEDADIKALCDHFASRKAYDTNEYTGLFEGYNLIWICCESFSDYAIDPKVTPLMYEMAQNGIILENFYNSFPNITTNGEFAFDTSLWPDVSRSASNGKVVGSFPQSAGVFMPYGLGDLFSEKGVNCYAYHNYRGDYYMRDYSWPNLGYDRSLMKFMGQGMTFSSPWPASDLEMMQQSVDDFIGEDQFHAYYMTFSGHGPYDETNTMFRKNIDKVRELAGDRFKNEQCLGYLCGEYELELALEYLTERLEEAGKLDKTVIVLIGDHYPYYLSDEAAVEFAGGTLPEGNERFRSDCIIYNAGMDEPIRSDTYCCNVDILPTILNLFGMDFDSRLLMGQDIFSNGIHHARLYNGSFVTKYVSYDVTTGREEWSPDGQAMGKDEQEAYLKAMIDYTTSEYEASLGVIDKDLYFYIWRNSGLMSADEVEAEEERQEKGKVIYASREEADRIKAEEWERKKAEEEAAAAAEENAAQDGQTPADGTQPADGAQPAPADGANAGQPAPADGTQPANATQPAPAPAEGANAEQPAPAPADVAQPAAGAQ